MKDFWTKFFDLIEKYLPGLILAFTAGKRVGEHKVQEVKVENEQLKLEAAKLKNQVELESKMDSKSDIDHLIDVLNDGKKPKL